jgi:AraC-like DNA-binding protein
LKKVISNSDDLKENISHGNILFSLAIHLTQHKVATDIMLYTHWHEELEILYIIDGNMLLQVDTQILRVQKGDIVIIPPNRIHGAIRIDNSSCDFYAIVFHQAFIGSYINDAIEQSYIEPFLTKTNRKFYYIDEKFQEQKNIVQKVSDIIQAYNLRYFGYELFIKANLLHLLFYLVKLNSEEEYRVNEEDLVTTLRIKKILTYLEENYQQPFSLSEWASCIELSREQFSRVFKKHFSCTPMEYVMNYRISKAADLLIHSQLPIIDIAFETGFESANYFTIAFKNKTNITPREFRKQNLK